MRQGQRTGKTAPISRLTVEPLEDRILPSGLVTSQGDRLLKADQVRALFAAGYDGTGITIGVISNSYDSLQGGANDAGSDIASGDLPSTVGRPANDWKDHPE
jgi:hypothetical protein